MRRQLVLHRELNRLSLRAHIGLQGFNIAGQPRRLPKFKTGQVYRERKLLFSSSAIRNSSKDSHDNIGETKTITSLHQTIDMQEFRRIILRSQVHHDGQEIAEILINNPKKLNSLDGTLIRELTSAINTVSKKHDLRCVILSGKHDSSPTKKSPAFCAGASLDEMSRLNTSQEAADFINQIKTLNAAVQNCPVPVIAAIDGHCYGAGLELAASCDVRYATKISKFAMPEVLVGIPSVVQARLLIDLMGSARAKYLMLFGKTIDADDAYRQGLVNQVFGTAEDMDARINQDVQRLMSKCGPEAVSVQKRLFETWNRLDVDAGIEAGVDAFASMWVDGGREPKAYMDKALERLKNKDRTE